VVGALHLTFFLLLQGVALPSYAMLSLFGAIVVVPLVTGFVLLLRKERRAPRLAARAA